MVDLINMKGLVWSDGEGRKGEEWEVTDVPDELVAEAEAWRAKLLDALADFDDVILTKYAGEEEITPDDLRQALRRGTLASQCVPVLCGSAFKNKGVQPMLDAVIDFLPAPPDLAAIKGLDPKGIEELERPGNDDAPFSALAFKIMSDPHVGKLTYFRVYSGTLETGSYVYNSSKDRRERVGRLLQMHANSRADREAIFAGDIVAAIGLKNTTTGDTLCDPDQPIVLESIDFPEPVIHVAVEPKTKADQDKLSKASRRSPTRTRPSRSAPMTRPARP